MTGLLNRLMEKWRESERKRNTFPIYFDTVICILRRITVYILFTKSSDENYINITG